MSEYLPAHDTGTCPSGEVTLHYRKLGQPGATPILIVHGLSYFSYDWVPVAAELACDREVVAMDMRGFGDSSWSPSEDYSLDSFAGDIAALLDHLGWDRAILMGHSMGGRNTTYFAAKHPDRVERLVLVDYSPVNAKQGGQRVARTVAGVPDAFADVDQAMDYFGADKADPVKRARMEAYLRPVEGGYGIKRDTLFRERFKRQIETGEKQKLGADMWQVLAEVRCPILEVRGTRSDMFAAETAEQVKKTNPNLTLVEVDAGHNVAGDNPQALLSAVRPFLA